MRTLAINKSERQALIALTEPVETPNNTHYSFYPHAREEASGQYRLTLDGKTAARSRAHNRFCERALLFYSEVLFSPDTSRSLLTADGSQPAQANAGRFLYQVKPV